MLIADLPWQDSVTIRRSGYAIRILELPVFSKDAINRRGIGVWGSNA